MGEEVIGAAFPVPANLLNRILNEGKKVFVKYPTLTKELKPGKKILFYASRNIHAIIGEAEIEKIEILTPEETLRKHRGEMFITEEEFKEYTMKPTSIRRKAKKLLVIKLKKTKKQCGI